MKSGYVYPSIKTFFQSTAILSRLKIAIGLLPAATKLGQGNVFTGVCLSTGGVLPQCMLGYHHHHPRSRPPRPATPPTRHPPRTRQTPPRPGRHPPPRPGRPPQEADSRIRSTSGRYASYWDAFLLKICSVTRRYLIGLKSVFVQK